MISVFSTLMSLPGKINIIIIGAGQAGLSAAHELIRRGLKPEIDFLILDANPHAGGAWQHRWDSLTLGKAHNIANLPGLPLESEDSSTPASQIVSNYYQRYEEHFDLKVLRPVSVRHVDPLPNEDLILHCTLAMGTSFTIRTQLIINATGTWTRPFIPSIPGIHDFKGTQLHTVDFRSAEDFSGQRTVVVGGGLSAVQFLLELAPLTDTLWATRRPPEFVDRDFDLEWGKDVEEKVRSDTFHGRPLQSVVSNTGIPSLPEYLEAVDKGILVSRGMFQEITPEGVIFPDGFEEVDTIFWNTGFRPALTHLRPLRLREPGGGIRMADEAQVAKDPRILLSGYGSTASTIGATRSGRLAARHAVEYLENL